MGMFAEEDVDYMQQALVQAKLAGARGEVPVGAVVVQNGRILGAAGNQREATQDPTAHAEMLALRQAAQTLGSWRLTEAALYVTQEPCPMCAGAMVHARIHKVVYGCDNPKAGAARTLYRLLTDDRLNHQALVLSGVCAAACADLLRAFFQTLRMQGKK